MVRSCGNLLESDFTELSLTIYRRFDFCRPLLRTQIAIRRRGIVRIHRLKYHANARGASQRDDQGQASCRGQEDW